MKTLPFQFLRWAYESGNNGWSLWLLNYETQQVLALMPRYIPPWLPGYYWHRD